MNFVFIEENEKKSIEFDARIIREIRAFVRQNENCHVIGDNSVRLQEHERLWLK